MQGQRSMTSYFWTAVDVVSMFFRTLYDPLAADPNQQQQGQQGQPQGQQRPSGNQPQGYRLGGGSGLGPRSNIHGRTSPISNQTSTSLSLHVPCRIIP